MNWSEYIGTAIAAAGGGLAAYLAIRIDIAVLKVRMDNADEHRKRIEEDAHDAHDRIDKLRRFERDTR